MREENKIKRQAQIEQAAYDVLKESGYGGTSMLKIARRAKASNETLYRWYEDKVGLFRALVAKNAQVVREPLEAQLNANEDAEKVLKTISPILLGLLLSDQAIALNQAAAADPSGELGTAIADAGRKQILPLICQIFDRAKADPNWILDKSEEAAELYITLLVGDLQIRRAIGQIPSPDEAFIKARADKALTLFFKLAQK